MNMKATALTATTVAIASLLPSMGETNVQKANAEQLSNIKTGYVKVDQVALHTEDNVKSTSIDTIRFNTKVNILETTNGWYKVSVHNKVGYVQKDAILLKNKLQSNDQYIVNANALNVRSEPNLESSILDVLPNGKFITVQEDQGEWYKISHNGQTGTYKKHSSLMVHNP